MPAAKKAGMRMVRSAAMPVLRVGAWVVGLVALGVAISSWSGGFGAAPVAAGSSDTSASASPGGGSARAGTTARAGGQSRGAVEPTTGETHLRHHISPTGFYRGRKVLKTKNDA